MTGVQTCALPISHIDIVKLLNSLNVKIEEYDSGPHVFIIDEINRGNISKIFGELITLIEDTKRKGMPGEISAILPYSGEEFSVPSNVYIIGTMNTADRSIAVMDTALRRRFNFIEMMPDSDLLINTEKMTIDLKKMLDAINQRIEYLYDREHTIGHAFFMKLRDNEDLNTLKDIFLNSIIPLLQEYFYEDYSKIQIILGSNGKQDEKFKFIIEEDIKSDNIFFGNIEETGNNIKYSINKEAFDHIESYLYIYDQKDITRNDSSD